MKTNDLIAAAYQAGFRTVPESLSKETINRIDLSRSNGAETLSIHLYPYNPEEALEVTYARQVLSPQDFSEVLNPQNAPRLTPSASVAVGIPPRSWGPVR